MIDTGATRTTVSERLVEAHGLPPRARMLTQGARSGPERRRAYGFRLGLYRREERSSHEGVSLYVSDDDFAAPPFVGNDCFDLLIGNDLLSTGRFILDRSDFRFEWA